MGDYRTLNNILIFGYFYKKYSGDKNAKTIHITKDTLLNYRNIDNNTKEKICGDVFEILKNNFENYYEKLYKVIFVHCVQK